MNRKAIRMTASREYWDVYSRLQFPPTTPDEVQEACLTDIFDRLKSEVEALGYALRWDKDQNPHVWNGQRYYQKHDAIGMNDIVSVEDWETITNAYDGLVENAQEDLENNHV